LEKNKTMGDNLIKYLILFLVGMCGVLIGRRTAIRRIIKKKSENEK